MLLTIVNLDAIGMFVGEEGVAGSLIAGKGGVKILGG